MDKSNKDKRTADFYAIVSAIAQFIEQAETGAVAPITPKPNKGDDNHGN